MVQRAADDLGLRVLRREPGEDDVVTRHRGHPARLDLHHAVREAAQRQHVEPQRQAAQHPLGRRPERGAHPLPPQVLGLAHPAADRHEQALRRRHVGAGELDRALAVAGDGELVDHDVDLRALQRRRPVGDVQHDELDLVRVAEDRRGDRVHDVDVGADELPGLRVAVAGEVLALVDPGDEAAARGDLRHRRAGGQGGGEGSPPCGRRLSLVPAQAGAAGAAVGAPAGAAAAGGDTGAGPPPGSSRLPTASTPAAHR